LSFQSLGENLLGKKPRVVSSRRIFTAANWFKEGIFVITLIFVQNKTFVLSCLKPNTKTLFFLFVTIRSGVHLSGVAS